MLNPYTIHSDTYLGPIRNIIPHLPVAHHPFRRHMTMSPLAQSQTNIHPNTPVIGTQTMGTPLGTPTPCPTTVAQQILKEKISSFLNRPRF